MTKKIDTRFIQNHEDFLALLDLVLQRLPEEIPARQAGNPGEGSAEELQDWIEKLEILKLQYQTAELPPREERTWEATDKIAQSWNTESDLGFALCELISYYCDDL